MIGPDDIEEVEEEEGHAKEWQDRARVTTDANQHIHEIGSPKQSPGPDEPLEDVEEKSKSLREKNNESY
jgi:hypothetical protein